MLLEKGLHEGRTLDALAGVEAALIGDIRFTGNTGLLYRIMAVLTLVVVGDAVEGSADWRRLFVGKYGIVRQGAEVTPGHVAVLTDSVEQLLVVRWRMNMLGVIGIGAVRASLDMHGLAADGHFLPEGISIPVRAVVDSVTLHAENRSAAAEVAYMVFVRVFMGRRMHGTTDIAAGNAMEIAFRIIGGIDRLVLGAGDHHAVTAALRVGRPYDFCGRVAAHAAEKAGCPLGVAGDQQARGGKEQNQDTQRRNHSFHGKGLLWAFPIHYIILHPHFAVNGKSIIPCAVHEDAFPGEAYA